MRASLTVVTALVLGAVSAGSAHRVASAQAVEVLVFEGARLIAGDGSGPVEDAALVVRAGTIEQVGRRGALQVPTGAARVDLTGKTVMPMIVNLHGHVGYVKGTSLGLENYSRANIIDHLRRYEYYGVGAVLSPGTAHADLEYQIRDEQRSGAVNYARLFTGGLGFTAPNGGAPNSGPQFVLVHEVDREDEARVRVRELAVKKVDLIKIWVDDRLGRRPGGEAKPKLQPAVYRAIIDEAHKLAIRVIAHVYYLADAKDLVRAGVDGFAHMVRDVEVDDEFVRLAKERNVFIATSVGVIGSRGLDSPAFAEVVAPSVVAHLKKAQTGQPASGTPSLDQAGSRMRASIAKLKAAGVRLALGTDSGRAPETPFGYQEHLELQGLVAAGLTPHEAITAGTSVPAQILGIKDLGSLTVGKSADFIVLDANPLDDIKNTLRIAKVYRKGRAIDREGRRAAWQKETFSP